MKTAVRWGLAAWTVGVTAVIAALPWSVHRRLPTRLATHWGTHGGHPDGSMPLWAASLFPALLWLALALTGLLTRRRAGAAALLWSAVPMLATGILLAGVQATVVRANLDRADWHDARLPALWFVATIAAAAVAAAGSWLLTMRSLPKTPRPSAPSAELDVPPDERLAWFSRTTNRWLSTLAAIAALLAVAAAVALAVGMAAPGPLWSAFAALSLLSLSGAAFASVRASVSERGLEVAFGPLGWPARRWAPADIESAHAENRTPAQVGGWGYRLSRLGTTVMLRAGECLVVRIRGRRGEFAVSVDDAERGAALLNALLPGAPAR